MSEVDDPTEDLFDGAPFGYLITSADGLIERVNATFLSWTGYDRADLEGARRFQDLLSVGGRIYHETHLGPLQVMQGFLREIALELRRADDSRLPVLLSSVVEPARPGGTARVRLALVDATERRMFEQELQNTQRRLERLQRTSTAFAAALTAAEVASSALEEIVDGIKADHGLVALLEGGVLRVLDSRPADVDLDGWADLTLASCGVLADVVAEQRPAFIERGAGGERGVPSLSRGGHGDRRAALLPLTVDGRVIGLLVLAAQEQDTFSTDERAFLVAFASLCAQALERARLHDAAALAATRLQFLNDLSQRMGETTSFRERAVALVESLVPDLADYATVEIPERGPAPVAVCHRDDALRDTLVRLRSSVTTTAEHLHSMAAARATRQPQVVVEIDESMFEAYGLDDQQLSWLQALAPRSYVGLPLVDRDRLVGSLMVVMSESGRIFDASALDFLTEVAERAAVLLENARLYEHEQSVARALQSQLLTHVLPADPRASVVGHYSAGAEMVEVGGDWYDAFWVGPDCLGLVVGDVVGRGVRAAAVMGQLRTALRAYAVEGLGVTETLARLDRFTASVAGATCSSVAYAELALDTGTLRYACAGHPPPLLEVPGHAPEALWEGRSALLGISPSTPKPEATVDLLPGSAVLLYTDGLVESRTRPVDAGIEELKDRLHRDPLLGADLPGLVEALVPPATERDDVCLLRTTWQGARGGGC